MQSSRIAIDEHFKWLDERISVPKGTCLLQAAKAARTAFVDGQERYLSALAVGQRDLGRGILLDETRPLQLTGMTTLDVDRVSARFDKPEHCTH